MNLLLLQTDEKEFILTIIRDLGALVSTLSLFGFIFYRIMMKLLNNQQFTNQQYAESNERRDIEINSLRKEALVTLQMIKEILESLKITTNSLKALEDNTASELKVIKGDVSKMGSNVDEIKDSVNTLMSEFIAIITEISENINQILSEFEQLEKTIIEKVGEKNENGTS